MRRRFSHRPNSSGAESDVTAIGGRVADQGRGEARRGLRGEAAAPASPYFFAKGCCRLAKAAPETECAEFSVRVNGQPSCFRRARL
jgi:hypothetical protein